MHLRRGGREGGREGEREGGREGGREGRREGGREAEGSMHGRGCVCRIHTHTHTHCTEYLSVSVQISSAEDLSALEITKKKIFIFLLESTNF
jgi:hypothetical protein